GDECLAERPKDRLARLRLRCSASLTVVVDRHLAEVNVHVQPDETHERLLPIACAGARRARRPLRIRAHATPARVAGAATYLLELAAQTTLRLTYLPSA